MNRTVAGAGLTSALGDFCYETTTVILPGFLAVLGIPAAALGLIEGAADALASFTKMVAGHLADRLGHRKALVVAGYALTPVGQMLIALAAGWPLLLAGRLVSWFGKGLRGPLRDAIVVQAVSETTRGRAFGFHRAADTLGAVAGPLLGVALLGWARGLDGGDPAWPFRLVLWLSLVPGVLAVLAFLLLVRDPGESPNPGLRLMRSLRELPARFKRYLAAIGLFGVGDFSHSLLILAATTLLAPSLGVVEAAQVAGLLYVGRNVVQVLASFPIGALADRVGHRPVLVAGYALGALTGGLMALAMLRQVHSVALLAGVFVVAGLYTAVQEALESTVTASMVPADRLSTSYGALGTVNGAAKFVSSAAVGLAWSLHSPAAGFALAAGLMLAGTLAMLRTR
nr:MFS transporter [Dyella lutea]